MDKNIAAFLDDKAYTIAVTFQPSNDAPYQNGAQKEYTYVTNIPGIKVGDWVVVPTSVGSQNIVLPTEMATIEEVLSAPATSIKTHVHRGQLQVVRVTGVDTTVEIAPNDSKLYAWVVSKVDLLAYSQLMDRNTQITAATTKAYRRSMQRSFADRILGDMDQADKDGLMKLLGK
jgi:hypothetical protein